VSFWFFLFLGGGEGGKGEKKEKKGKKLTFFFNFFFPLKNNFQKQKKQLPLPPRGHVRDPLQAP
jgi:hypothetical protein